MDLVWLCGFAFLAGLVDSLVGGGGLIQLPALFVLLPKDVATQVATVFGTNKLSSICGTTVAVVQYARRVPIRWATMLPATIAAFVFSFLGARAVTGFKTDAFKPVILVLLVAVAIYTYWNKNLGGEHRPKFPANRELLWGVLTGMGIGFYDGFFGPGTGSFLIFIFIGWFGFDFLSASASAKAVNFATNLSAVIYFAATDHILYAYALPMGLCNVLGSLVGTRLAILKGNRFIRWFFLAVVGAMIARFGWEVVSGRFGK